MIDPFMDSCPETTRQQHQAYSLFELNNKIGLALEEALPACYWVTAEVSEMRVASNGHCYLELVQKDGRGATLIAKARGIIWRDDYIRIAGSFERMTGRRFTFGLHLMLYVKVCFHELYGYSLTVTDIDPTFTIGALALRKKEILRQLQEDGVMDLNKELALPAIPSRVAVISSATAAGYGDFCNQLKQSGYRFNIRLFPAVMQGDKVEESVINALDSIAAKADEWDVVVIIRGGGATLDLHGFDSYLLASNVAQFPLPILTGIGHERDETIIDRVAHTRLKTPTAVAAFLIERRTGEDNKLRALQERLTASVLRRIHDETSSLAVSRERLHHASETLLMRHRRTLEAVTARFGHTIPGYLAARREALLRRQSKLEMYAGIRLQNERNHLDTFPVRMVQALERIFLLNRSRQELLQRSLTLADPKRVLAMGFSLTTLNGKVVKDAEQLAKGDEIVTRFGQGTRHSIVQ